jgi:tRNA-specific 2-thiouridylase
LRSGAAGIEVELIGGEDGVSPGQACVFYDAANGQPRVLGGGMIASTVASKGNTAQGAHAPAMAIAR